MRAMHTIGLNAHLLTAQAGYRSAGINGYIYNLLQALPQVDPSFQYIVWTGRHAQPPAEPRLTVRRSSWGTEKPLRRILWEQVIQPFAAWRSSPDLLHALAFVSPVLSRIPSVVTVYDLSFVHYPDRLPAARRHYLQLLTKRSCLHARRVIAISHSTAHDLVETFHIPANKIDIAPPGVGPQFRPAMSFDTEAFRHRHSLPERFLLFLGTLEPRKNLPVLLRAYARLPIQDRTQVHLVLAGGKGGMYDEVFRTIEEQGIADTVHLPGYVDANDLPLWYNAADALVYPSIFEGFGLPVIEAMACGTPVLVSNVSSLPEAAGDTGYCLPPDDVEAWTSALAHVIHNAAWREEAGHRAMQHAAQFSWHATAVQTVASYQKALMLL